jgi:aspartyl-tRNA(Asn)/glutamyl-tRNA(Gln) amidotransferase subunit A
VKSLEAIGSAPIVEILQALRRRQVSPVELADIYLQRIEQNAHLHAFISSPGQAARREARRAEQRLVRREGGPLLGLPIAVKDLFPTRGLRTTAGSRILRNWVPANDAVVIAQLRAAGALIFGKTNLHEFAYGVTTANPWFGVARNPHDEGRSPGGSSGGSAIAVVAGMTAAALGSDTGGSIRIPASLCGCVGLKPTFGSIPIAGTVPLAWTLDHPGPLTRTVDDAGILFDVLSNSSTWRRVRAGGRRQLAGLRVGMVQSRLLRDVVPAVSRSAEAMAKGMSGHSMRVRDIAVPELEHTVATQLVTLRAEASALHLHWLRTRPRSYGSDVRVRLQLGALISASDYVLAQRMRDRLREAVRRAFAEVDLLLLPTTPITAPVIGSRAVRWGSTSEPVDGALVRLTAPFNLAGVPALSIPVGDEAGLPIGVQLVAPWNAEARLLTAGRLVEDLSK